MTTKINQKIVGFEVIEDKPGKSIEEPVQPPEQDVEQMHEKVGRPEMLIGATYKIKSPVAEHALYITINDIVLNPDTEHELRRPFEVFINSKNLDHFQWVVALTRVISAVFRKGGDVTFMVEELKAVFDPKGGYFKPGGRYIPSLVAEIGDTLETHLKTIGLLRSEGLDETQQQFLKQKQQQYLSEKGEDGQEGEFPASATLCSKCHHKALIQMDGCLTCLNCGDSKCG